MAAAHDDQLARDYAALEKTYDEFAEGWDERHAGDAGYTEIEKFLGKWDWNGSILELGCGSGIIGAILKKLCPSAKLYGNDISPQMAEVAYKKGIYEKKVTARPLTDELKNSPPIDHAILWGVTLHLQPKEFQGILSQMFTVAQKSVTLNIDDFPDNFAEIVKGDPIAEISYDNREAWRTAEIPPEWKLVSSDRFWDWTHPPTGTEIYVYAIRYERA